MILYYLSSSREDKPIIWKIDATQTNVDFFLKKGKKMKKMKEKLCKLIDSRTSSIRVTLPFPSNPPKPLLTLGPAPSLSNLCASLLLLSLQPMWLHRPLLTKTLHLRYFTHSSAAALIQPEIPVLDDFPKPDPKYAETIRAVPRAASGKNISAKERKAGRVPSIVFEQEDGQHGGNKRLVSVQTNQIKKLVTHLGRSFFLSRLFDLEVRPDFESDDVIEKVRVLPRKVMRIGFLCGNVLRNRANIYNARRTINARHFHMVSQLYS